MKSTAFVSGCLLLILIISSCGKTTCVDPGIRITFKGYDTAELSRVLVLQYMSNKGFASVMNVSFLDTAYIDVKQSRDTTYMPVFDTSGIYVAPGYDYIVQVPSENKSYTITRISYTQLTQKAPSNGKGGCTNDAAYYLDSMPVSVGGQLFDKPNVPPVNIVLEK